MLKKLLESVREYKKASILAPLFVAAEVCVECIIPFITAKLVNNIEAGCDMPTLLKYASILVILAFTSLMFGVLSGHFCSIASCGFAKNLRHDLYYTIGDFSFTNIDKFSTSSLVTRLTTDVSNIQISYMMIIRTAVRSPLMMIFAFTMAMIVSPSVSLAFIVIIPILAIGLILIIKNAWGIFHSVFKKYDALNNSVQENVSGMRVVKAFVREKHETEKFKKASDDVCADFTRAEKLLALNNPLMQFCMNGLMVAVCFIGSYLVIKTGGVALKVGDLASLITYGVQILMSLMMLSMIIVTIALSMASAKRVTEVLCEKSSIINRENPVMEVADGSITFENVSFKYSAEAENFALADINLSIASGETVGIIGGTGSSKTSLIQLIPRLYDATEGSVRISGIDVRDYDIKTLRDNVAVWQELLISYS